MGSETAARERELTGHPGHATSSDPGELNDLRQAAGPSHRHCLGPIAPRYFRRTPRLLRNRAKN